MKYRKYIIGSFIVLLSSFCVFGTSTKGSELNNRYEDEIKYMTLNYEIEDKSIQIDRSKNTVSVNGSQTSLSKEFGISGGKEKTILKNEAKLKHELKRNGYEVKQASANVIKGDSNFASKRIYVDSSSVAETYGAIAEANGAHTVLQYESPEEAAVAYYSLKNDGYNVYPSYVVSLEEDENIVPESIDGEYIDNGVSFHGIDKMQQDDTYKNRKVTVAVIDTGINDYFSRNIQYYNFNTSSSEKDTNGHGTKVASVIADCTSDNVDFVSMKVFDDDSKSDMAAIESALIQCTDLDVDVINISIGIYDKNFEKECGTFGYWDDTFKVLKNNGTVVCVAAGNEGVHTKYVYPAGSDYTWTIGSIDVYGNIANTSNYGKIDFVAKGVGVICRNVSNIKVSVSGTSFASPYIAGIVANYKGKQDDLVDDIYEIVKNTAVDLGDTGKDEIYGYGYPCYQYKEEEFEHCEHKNIKEVTTDATCEEDGSIIYICKDCGEVIKKEILYATGHAYTEIEHINGSCSQRETIVYRCNKCQAEKTEYLDYDENNHLHTEIKITKDPSCTEDGEQRTYCMDCDFYIGIIEKIPHSSHTYEEISHTSGTCNVKEKITYKCSKCQQEKINYVGYNPDNHIHTEQRIIKEPSCTEDGKKQLYCTDCNTFIANTEESITHYDHKWVIIEETQGSCAEKSSVIYKCLNCGEMKIEYGNYNYQVHNEKYLTKKETIAPGCETAGTYIIYCKNCNSEIEKHSVSATGHDYQIISETVGTCVEKASTTYKCNKCNDTYTIYGTIDDQAHNFTTCVTDSSCQAFGCKKTYCLLCGKVISSQIIPKKNHIAFTSKGTTICKTCGEILSVDTYKIKLYDGSTENILYAKYGDMVTLPVLTKRDFVFDGWINSNKERVSQITVTDNASYTAKWRAKDYVLTINANNGQYNKSSIKVTYGKTIHLSNPKRKGYLFTGWYVGSRKKSNTFKYKYHSNVTVKARWKKIVVKEPSISKIGAIYIKINSSQANHYQVYVSKNKNFKNKRIYETTKKKLTVKKLKKGKYYIKIRAYTYDSSGKKVYSSWKRYKY